MRALALTLETIAGHTSTEGKVLAAAAYLASQDASSVGAAARFLSGAPLPRGTSATNVGRATLVELAAALVDRDRQEILRLAALERLGGLGAGGRKRVLRAMLERATPLEVKYLTKLLLGSLRTAMQEARVEEAIALAFDRPLAQVRRANMLLGDIGPTSERAAADRLESVDLQAFRPVRVMLAHPCDSPKDVIETLALPVLAEDKFDGIRAQAHLSGHEVRFYSRALEDLTHCFPELREVPTGIEGEWILDGEVVAWLDGRCLSFATLQRRLGRKQVPMTLLLDASVSFLAFDVLRAGSEDLLEAPLQRRKEALDRLPATGPIRRTPYARLETSEQIADWFEAALERGNEGAVFKSPDSPYRPGARGRAWVKLKRALGSLDVVVTAAEYGRGKRARMLSDLVFAVRGSDGLVDSGRVYSGLTDHEILDLTRHFKSTTRESLGGLVRVEPSVALEVAFDDIRRSGRHPSGFALRFPRILRRRVDLTPEEVSSIDDLRRLYEVTHP